MYSAAFGVTLVTLTLITTLLMLAVTSNVVLSLGMVGALSIVRFRTAIKEPMDIAFLFWSIAAGIVLAAGFILLLCSEVSLSVWCSWYSQAGKTWKGRIFWLSIVRQMLRKRKWKSM